MSLPRSYEQAANAIGVRLCSDESFPAAHINGWRQLSDGQIVIHTAPPAMTRRGLYNFLLLAAGGSSADNWQEMHAVSLQVQRWARILHVRFSRDMTRKERGRTQIELLRDPQRSNSSWQAAWRWANRD